MAQLNRSDRSGRARVTARWTSLVIVVLGLVWGTVAELRTSQLQAAVLSWFAHDMTFWLEPGVNPTVRFPSGGPYNERLGYARLPSFIESLAAGEFDVEKQARASERLQAFMVHGGFAVFHEKTRAGLTITERNGASIFAARFPKRVYDNFEEIPALIIDTLLFIENRELLDPRHPNRNPAVEWDRLAVAVGEWLDRAVHSGGKPAGGSTLATQMEKYRHSPGGRTTTAGEKLRQMTSASLRAYLDGEDTTAARRRIVVDYLNSAPLGGRVGFGEVIGLGDGLWAWYGTDQIFANRVLRAPARDDHDLQLRGLVYKQVLSLLLALRRPSFYLATSPQALSALTDRYLRRLASAGIIDPALRDAALRADLRIAHDPPAASRSSFVEQKATNAIRTRLLSLLGLSNLYALDRLDLTVETTFDAPTQERVTAVLRRLGDPAYIEAQGLSGSRLLGRGDPGNIAYSFTLYERGVKANYVRVQVDSLDQPFDINEGAKLDLGSTAKLRTLITYLEIIAELHGRYAGLEPRELDSIGLEAPDPLTRWTVRRLAATTDRSLSALLEAAMARRYSASPAERFFTGSGIHTFVNFSDADDRMVPTVAEALRRSVNLVFIRLMRDIVKYHIAEAEPQARNLLRDAGHPGRRPYLARFADGEGRDFLNRFYDTYRGHTNDERLTFLAERASPTPVALTVVFRSVRPHAAPDELGNFLRARLPGKHLEKGTMEDLQTKYSPHRLSLADRSHLAGVHPLELWLVGYLGAHPQTSRASVLAASAAARQESYSWLFKTDHKSAQDTRIRIVLEQDAFARIHRGWQVLGYPFDSLVPSYATALGSSADRPGALAELMGIIVNGGVRKPTLRIRRLRFAAATPYETVIGRKPEASEQVLEPEIAAILRQVLIDVVERGSGRRVRGAFIDPAGIELLIGGKTGTGDHRYERYGAGGQVIESRVVNRTATFAFFLDDRFFGVITAYVHGPEAARYRFTSALPVQLLRTLAPALRPLLEPARVRTAPSAGDLGKGLWAGASQRGPEHPQPGVALPRPGSVRRGRAAIQAGANYPGERIASGSP